MGSIKKEKKNRAREERGHIFCQPPGWQLWVSIICLGILLNWLAKIDFSLNLNSTLKRANFAQMFAENAITTAITITTTIRNWRLASVIDWTRERRHRCACAPLGLRPCAHANEQSLATGVMFGCSFQAAVVIRSVEQRLAARVIVIVVIVLKWEAQWWSGRAAAGLFPFRSTDFARSLSKSVSIKNEISANLIASM